MGRKKNSECGYHVILDVLYAKAPYPVIQRAMHIHSTFAEYLPVLFDQLEPLVD